MLFFLCLSFCAQGTPSRVVRLVRPVIERANKIRWQAGSSLLQRTRDAVAAKAAARQAARRAAQSNVVSSAIKGAVSAPQRSTHAVFGWRAWFNNPSIAPKDPFWKRVATSVASMGLNGKIAKRAEQLVAVQDMSARPSVVSRIGAFFSQIWSGQHAAVAHHRSGRETQKLVERVRHQSVSTATLWERVKRWCARKAVITKLQLAQRGWYLPRHKNVFLQRAEQAVAQDLAVLSGKAARRKVPVSLSECLACCFPCSGAHQIIIAPTRALHSIRDSAGENAHHTASSEEHYEQSTKNRVPFAERMRNRIRIWHAAFATRWNATKIRISTLLQELKSRFSRRGRAHQHAMESSYMPAEDLLVANPQDCAYEPVRRYIQAFQKHPTLRGLLGLPNDASSEHVRKACIECIRVCHPDRLPSSSSPSTEQLARVVLQYVIEERG